MSFVELLAVLLPHLASLRLRHVRLAGTVVRLEATTTGAARVACPDCGRASARVHSRYVRRLTDPGIGGREVQLDLTVRRFVCTELACPRRTFAEPVEQAVRHGRRTTLATAMMQAVALALGGRPGSRLTTQLATPVSRMTLLRLIRRLPDPAAATPTVLGVDDFAQRRGHRYATILLDMHTHRPVDVLPGRDADTLATWLNRHPGVQIICRDRAGSYADGAARGAPHALQVADRWHLIHNLGEAVQKVVVQHRRCLHTSPPIPTPPPTPAPTSMPSAPGRRATNTRDRHQATHALLRQGISLKEIARRLHLARNTVRRYAGAATAEDLLTTNPRRGHSPLEPFISHLQTRHGEGVTDARTLHAEIRTMGYRGALRTLQRCMNKIRANDRVPAPAPIPPARQITGWIMRPDARLSEDDRIGLKQARAQCPDLDTLTTLAHGFTSLVRNRTGTHLETWINPATSSPFPELRGFAGGLLRDYDAVVAGLTHHWNSGAVEGTVNRIKTIKRQMFGRANLDLLRKRVLART